MAVHITYFPHGTTYDNENHISSGWADTELSPLGIQQSKDLPGKIGDKRFDVVFCSDLKRARDSVRFAFEGQTPIILDARLRECNYGAYNGKESAVVEPMLEKMVAERFPEGESCKDVEDRITDFLNFLKQEYDGRSIAVISHKVPQLALEVLLKGKTWEQAFADDWRADKRWQSGWEYTLE
jgi:broad specificity phosphatase PhoE